MTKKNSRERIDKLKNKLSPIQYKVTQENATEPAFDNLYWNHQEEGIYVDVVSGEALFSSTSKFKSNSGWPAFSEPIHEKNIVKKIDKTLFMERTEVRSKGGDSHLGHVFDDGPTPEGKRYCINSAALKFIPKEKMKALGYEEYLYLFKEEKKDEKEKSETYEIATFSGGCFWCIEEAFHEIPGILEITVGYTGGKSENPTYETVSSGKTDHIESMQVKFNPKKVSYQELLSYFWKNIDPTTKNRQFCDVGPQYQSAIFYHDENQKKLSLESKKNLLEQKVIEKIETKITPASKFYPAEEYHQAYFKKNPIRYKFYKYSCGRKQRLDELWNKKKETNK
ncbi:MAG: peptide-methionine (S)-S-oxide reductase [Zetaproteobacteria bacterium]|nr:peptide-methionine (S)-S-oxide reductase [Pseudobdellovibrionaceae bacterium]